MKKIFVIITCGLFIAISGAMYGQDTMTVRETMPCFPGGENAFQMYLRNNLVCPDSAIDLEQEGTAFVYFEIDTAGAISNVQLKKKIPGAPYLDREAVRVISAMPNWIPGTINGKRVKVSMTVPVKFVLTQVDVDRRKKEKKQERKNTTK